MKTKEDKFFRMTRKDIKEFMQTIEEKARANGWNPDSPQSEMKRDGNLASEEFAQYQLAEAFVRQTVDLDEATLPDAGGSVELIRTLKDAKEASYVYGPGMADAFGARFNRLINSLALHLLVNVEKTIVAPESRKFVCEVRSHALRTVEVEAADEAEAKAKVESGLGEYDELESLAEAPE